MKYILTLIASVFMLTVSAQDKAFKSVGAKAKIAKPVTMADVLYANGAIYLLVLIILIVLLGLFGYVMYTEKRLGKIERENK